MRRSTVLLTFLSMSLACSSTQAQTIFVDSTAPAGGDGLSWATAFNDLQEALPETDCESGREVWVAAGTYTPGDPGDARTTTFRLRENVSVYGGFSGIETNRFQRDPAVNVTILSGDLNGNDVPNFVNRSDNCFHIVTSLLTFPNQTAPVLDGFTISGGNANGDPLLLENLGGGMHILGGSPTVANCIFTDNEASPGEGGGLFAGGASNPQISDCTFTGNRAGAGGGATASDNSSAVLTNCTFTSNISVGGGGMSCRNSNPTLHSCIFMNNEASSVGGGMWIFGGDPTLRNCMFLENTADELGGGISQVGLGGLTIVNSRFVLNSVDGANGGGGALALNGGGAGDLGVTLFNCQFLGNSAPGDGGAIWMRSNADATLANCSFAGNEGDRGGGIYVGGSPSACALVNCTLSQNHATFWGGGVYVVGSTVVSNCILWGNTASFAGSVETAQIDTGPAGVVTLNWSSVQGLTGNFGGVGNIGDDPLFLDADGADNSPGTEDDDLRLPSGSPCVDAADNAAVPDDTADLDQNGDTAEPLPFDLDGNPRVVDDPITPDCPQAPGACGTPPVVDMGAFELLPPYEEFDLDQGQTVLLTPPGGTGNPFFDPFVQITNISGPNNATVTVVATRRIPNPQPTGFVAGTVTLEISTSLADGEFLMSVGVPFAADDAGGNPLAVDLQFFDAGTGTWILTVAGNTQNSPGFPGPIGDRHELPLLVPTVPMFPPEPDLGDYGVVYRSDLLRGFAWGNVDHTTDFALASAPVSPEDCNGNGVVDAEDVENGSSADCNMNGIPDECDLLNGTNEDCNGNAIPDLCEVFEESATDCNLNAVPDECDITGGTSSDLNENGIPDECDRIGTCGDLNADGFIDLDDYALLEKSTTGPLEKPSPDLVPADLDEDGDIDVVDIIHFAERANAYPGFAPDCRPNAPVIRMTPRCFLPGETANMTIFVPPISDGGLELSLFALDHDEADVTAPLAGETAILDGSPSYPFSVTLPNEAGSYLMVARLLDGNGDEVGSSGVDLGVRPDILAAHLALPCTFEVFSVDAAALLSQVDSAITLQVPLVLEIGSRSFEVLVEDNNDMVDPDILVNNPTLRLARGQVVEMPESAVALTFVNDAVYVFVDPGGEESAVYMEPATIYDDQQPLDLYIGYAADDVPIPRSPHTVLGGTRAAALNRSLQEPGRTPAATVQGGDQILVNLYYDFDAWDLRFAVFNTMAAAFRVQLGVDLRMTFDTQFITDGYGDGLCEGSGLLDDFICDAQNDLGFADIALLMTWNPAAISYAGDCTFAFLGRCWSRPQFFGCASGGQGQYAARPFCWVRNDGSIHRRSMIGLQEISHILGASFGPGATATSHRDGRVRIHCHARACVPFTNICTSCLARHKHYSVMREFFNRRVGFYDFVFGVVIDPRWLRADRRTILQTLCCTCGHFGNPPNPCPPTCNPACPP